MAEKEVAPQIVSTNGLWKKLEDIVSQEFEVGKTYHIQVKRNCEFMVSKNKPEAGIITNEITFKKEPDVFLWIKTGE